AAPAGGVRAGSAAGGPAAEVAAATGAALCVLPVTRAYSTVAEVVWPLVTRSAMVSSRSPARSVMPGYWSGRTNAPAEVSEAPVMSALRSGPANGWDWTPLTAFGMTPFLANRLTNSL